MIDLPIRLIILLSLLLLWCLYEAWPVVRDLDLILREDGE